MKPNEYLKSLEQKKDTLRFDLMLTSSQLEVERNNLTQESFDRHQSLVEKMRNIRNELSKVNAEITKLKFAYLVIYEVKYITGMNDRIERQVFQEVLLLDRNVAIDFPDKTYYPLTNEVSSLFSDIFSRLATYEQVTILRVKRI